MTTSSNGAQLSPERADLLEALEVHRGFLRVTARDLTEEQARQRSTTSSLTIGGLIKHVAATEERWARFITDGPSALGGDIDPNIDLSTMDFSEFEDGFRLTADETLAGVLARYDEVARATNELLATLPDLDARQPLPKAPWFPPNATRSARRAFVHIIAETAQHAGHADIIRESIDGQKTMG
jgi:uncharacterized damage-inducible protein DinB